MLRLLLPSRRRPTGVSATTATCFTPYLLRRHASHPTGLRRWATTMAILPDEWKRVADSGAPPFHVYTKPICKSEQDDREYRVIRLENGLEATVIHDSETDKAAASLGVAVGHLNDPVSEAVLRSSITEECGTVLKD